MGMRNFNKFVFFPKFLQDPSLIDTMLPKTLDEMKAEDENTELKKDKMPDVADTDNHTTHIYIHQMVMPKTWATWMHIEWHQELLAQQKAQQMQQAQQQAQMQQGQPGQPGQPPNPQQPGQPTQPSQPKQINVGAEKRSPIAAASPLKTAITNQPRITQ